MAIYEAAVLSNNSVITSPAWDIMAGGANSPRVMQIDISVSSATAASSFGIGRPGNDGSVSQNGANAFQSDDPNAQASQTSWATAWNTAPTVPAVFFRRVFLPNTLMASAIFTFPRGILINVSRGLVCWNLATNTAQITANVIINE